MAVDVTLNTIGSGFNLSIVNNNFQLIETALQDALSRSGSSPNNMSADLDLDGNDILNAKDLGLTGDLIYKGELIVPSDIASIPLATPSLSGLMPSTDKTKLDTLGLVYDTVALLLASTEASRGTGEIWRIEGSDGNFTLVEVSSGGEVTTTGGIQLRLTKLNQDNSITPAYVETLSTGLAPLTPTNVTNLEITVTGTKGSAVLTTSETTKVAGLGSDSWEGALVPDVGLPFFVTVLSNNGSTTITLRDNLDAAFTGKFYAKYDATLGQHLSLGGTKAYAAHLSRQTGLTASRGRVMNSINFDRDADFFAAVWAKNAALTSYGVSSSGGVTTSLIASSARNIKEVSDDLPVRPVNFTKRGILVGTHLAGHGVDGTIRLNQKDSVIEFYVGGYRDTVALSGVAISVSVKVDGVEVFSDTTDHILRRYAVSVHAGDEAVVAITNTDGAIYYMELNQLTVREAGLGGKLIPAGSRVATFGDSWFTRQTDQFPQSLREFTGAYVDNFALGGTTTVWALSWFDTYIKGKGYDVVVFHFFTNDHNQVTGTFVAPDGSTPLLWPAGLTADQSKDLWRDNLQTLISLTQAEGARPVIINAGGTASNSQMQEHAQWSFHLDKSTPIDWVPEDGELSDSGSFINNYGKHEGASVLQGQGRVYAAGAAASDPWADPVNDGLVALQKLTLTAANYLETTSVDIGNDAGSGLSVGLAFHSFGTIETGGETFTPTIVSGRQRYAADFKAGNTGNKRIQSVSSVVSGVDYMILVKIVGGTASETMEFLEAVTDGGYSTVAGPWTLDGSGNGLFYFRGVAGGTASRGYDIAYFRDDGVLHTFDLDPRSGIYDLDALFVDAPNVDGLEDSDLANFIDSLL